MCRPLWRPNSTGTISIKAIDRRRVAHLLLLPMSVIRVLCHRNAAPGGDNAPKVCEIASGDTLQSFLGRAGALLSVQSPSKCFLEAGAEVEDVADLQVYTCLAGWVGSCFDRSVACGGQHDLCVGRDVNPLVVFAVSYALCLCDSQLHC